MLVDRVRWCRETDFF